MQNTVQSRIASLKNELEMGKARLQELEQQHLHVRDTMLRISGAIQVLEELQKETAPMSDVPGLDQNGSDLAALGSNAQAKGA